MAKQVEGIIYVTAHERVMHCIPMTCRYRQSWLMDIRKAKSAVDCCGWWTWSVWGCLSSDSAWTQKNRCSYGKKDSLHAQARLVGYQKALRDNGIVYDPNLLHRETGQEKVDIEWQMNCLHMMWQQSFVWMILWQADFMTDWMNLGKNTGGTFCCRIRWQRVIKLL